MSDKRQKNQLVLAFADTSRSEAPRSTGEGTESLMAQRRAESPASIEPLMEIVCERSNCKRALARVKRNKGSAGIEGMTVEQLPAYLKQHWPAIRQQLLSGTYKPEPVKRVEIPKPDGGMRKLGIPTVLDRFIQQAGNAGAATHLGRDVFPPQLRVSPAAVGASGGNQGAAIPCRGLSLGSGLGLREILRPSKPRQTDGADCQTNQRPANAETDSGVSQSGSNGRRVGESGGRRDAARWALVTVVVEHCARRVGPRVGAPGTSFRAVCGRQQDLRAQPTGR